MDYDYIIVGSGVAGTTVAKELLEDNAKLSILILEAGKVSTLKDRRLWWNYVKNGKQPYAQSAEDEFSSEESDSSVGKTPMELKGSRLMTYGGSTVHWGGWSLRLKPEDFKLNQNTGKGIDWPISYSDLMPFYNKAESYLSVCGTDNPDTNHFYPLPPFPFAPSDEIMIKGFKKLGWSYNSMPLARYRKCMQTGTCKYCPIGARYTAAYILDELCDSQKYPGFTVRCNSAVRRLHMNSDGFITSVEGVDNITGLLFNYTAKKIILACGTIETPKLLLASSNEVSPKGIGNKFGMVGRNFIVHPFLFYRGKLEKDDDSQKNNEKRLQQEYDFATLMSRHFDTEKTGTIDCQNKGKLFLFKSRSRPRTKLSLEMKKGMTSEQILDLIENFAEFEIQAFMEDFPKDSNYITLKKGVYDRFGLPQSEINYSQDQDFEDSMNFWLDKMKTLLIEMRVKPSDNIRDFGIRFPRADHAGGTCRMSNNPKEGVVDENLKLWESQNLFIISNAVFPNLGAVNPTLTLTALAFRLAKHLKETTL
jgi:choline dehydrogenase-like flavoprotein